MAGNLQPPAIHRAGDSSYLASPPSRPPPIHHPPTPPAYQTAISRHPYRRLQLDLRAGYCAVTVPLPGRFRLVLIFGALYS